ncbi:Hypothetical protein A7982_03432 [Minicystis rosea]|nr:Hypothetical protein A7982_03432 [Minicystis rosea]
MDDAALGLRCEELAHAVLAPLVLGGPVHPVRPFGGPLALRCGVDRRIADGDLALQLDVARVRRARLYAPVDALPELDEGDWALLAALNDLIQISNHRLASALTRGRYLRLAGNLDWLCARIPAPRDVEGALSRHATFARVLEIARTDSTVSWWTGSARFRGEPPPARLLAWREVRRVRVDTQKVPLADMATGVAGVVPDDYAELLALWLGRSPLTDLATAVRSSPLFAWSASTLSLVATPPGKALALRALCREPADVVLGVLRRAAAQVPPRLEEARRLADGMVASAEQAFAALAEDETTRTT